VFNGEAHRQIAFSDPGIDDYRNELSGKADTIQAEIQLWDKTIVR